MKREIQEKCQVSSVVIGGGFGGIAAALRLRALGHTVTLLERLDALGGRAQVFEKNGYKHDAGPTVITAPFYLTNFLNFSMKKGQITSSLSL